MRTYRIILTVALSLLVFAVLSGCGSGSDVVDITGLNQVTLRIEGMT